MEIPVTWMVSFFLGAQCMWMYILSVLKITNSTSPVWIILYEANNRKITEIKYNYSTTDYTDYCFMQYKLQVCKQENWDRSKNAPCEERFFHQHRATKVMHQISVTAESHCSVRSMQLCVMQTRGQSLSLCWPEHHFSVAAHIHQHVHSVRHNAT